jgi:hypothetical protein
MEAPQNRRFYGKKGCLPLWPTYIGEKGRTFDKTYGIKARCYWECPWGTHWEPREHYGNLMGTSKEHVGNKRKMLSLPIGCMKFRFPKLFVTISTWANKSIIN